MRSSSSLVALLLLSSILQSCASYQSALGYRAREASLKKDVGSFEKLMEEAATKPPAFPGDQPVRTVLSHFLELGGEDRFLPMIAGWMKRGWVDEAQSCVIQRARYKGVLAKDPAEAQHAAEVSVARAEKAAETSDRSWEIAACLEGAPFLSQSSTVALAPYLAKVADPALAPAVREALLDGMTHQFLQDPELRMTNTSSVITRAAATRASAAQLEAVRTRFVAIVDRSRTRVELDALAQGTAFGALELERVTQQLGASFLADQPAELAWAWVRAMKSKDRVARLDRLGLWDKLREPAGDTFWYLCLEAPTGAGPATIEAVGIIARGPLEDPSSVCPLENNPATRGPFPLESSARAVVGHELTVARGAPVSVVVSRRVSAP